MMTAMNVAHLPPAMVRSGRVELWLEMKLPDPQARTDILSAHLKNQPQGLPQVDLPRLTSATEGFTGADLKRLIEDGKAIYAYDKSRGTELLPTTDYFMRAVETVQQNKQHYAAAEARALMQPKSPFSGLFGPFMPPKGFGRDADED